MVRLLVLLALASVELVRATAVGVKRQDNEDIITLNSAQIDTFTPFTRFASAAYCNPSLIRNWNCGDNCNAVPGFLVVAAGGDGDRTQFWYVGYSSSFKTVVIAHQGTDTRKLFADLTDVDILLQPLDPSLFPGIPPYVTVHNGFALEQARTAWKILSTVQEILLKQPFYSVTVVGHSLGGALALLDGVFLRLQLPEGVPVKVISYGMPRVGNKPFADFVDSKLSGNVTHVNNREDRVPTMPDMSLGYHHPSGEIHILDSGEWDACPGQDNPSKLCIVGDVKKASPSDHNGSYAGIMIRC